MGIGLFTMPAYMRFFGDQQVLGVWFTLLSVVNWILNLDLGVGNGLRNRLVEALAEGDLASARRYISSAYIMVFGVVVLLGVSLTGFLRLVDWNTLLGVSPAVLTPPVVEQAVAIATLGVLLQFGLRLIVSILYALQYAALTGALSVATSVGMLLGVILAGPGTDGSRIVYLAKVSVIAVNLPLLVATVLVFATRLKTCTPRPRDFDRRSAWDVAKVGGLFFALQLLFMFVTTTDPFLISRIAEPRYVVDYQVYSRVFFLGSTIFTLALTPIWSAVTQAYAQGDLRWIETLYKRMKRLAYAAGVGLIGLCWLLPWLIKVWLGRQAISIDIRYSLVFAALSALLIWTGVMSSVVNGTGRLTTQLATLTAGALVKIPAALLLMQMIHSWIAVVCASAIALAPYAVLQPKRIERFLRQRHSAVAGQRGSTARLGG